MLPIRKINRMLYRINFLIQTSILFKISSKISFCLFLSLLCFIGYAQKGIKSDSDVIFESFTGTAYKMPIIEKKIGNRIAKRIQEHYSEEVYSYPEIGEISLDEIKVPESTVGRSKFPGLDRDLGFCMVLNSKMYIKNEGCYEFTLNSDDGSILWIDGTKVVNNDGGHQMKKAIDSIALNKGEYDIKLWYFQGMPDRFGFIFNSKRVGGMEACDASIKTQEFELSSNLLFNTGEYILNQSAQAELDELFNEISQSDILSIDITGHTDNIGSAESNKLLSERRAKAIAEAFRNTFNSDNIIISTTGRGEEEPKSNNETASGREENRRVEIRITLKTKKQ